MVKLTERTRYVLKITRSENGYNWACEFCGKRFNGRTPQGVALSRSNHLRSHKPKEAELRQQEAQR